MSNLFFAFWKVVHWNTLTNFKYCHFTARGVVERVSKMGKYHTITFWIWMWRLFNLYHWTIGCTNRIVVTWSTGIKWSYLWQLFIAAFVFNSLLSALWSALDGRHYENEFLLSLLLFFNQFQWTSYQNCQTMPKINCTSFDNLFSLDVVASGLWNF